MKLIALTIGILITLIVFKILKFVFYYICHAIDTIQSGFKYDYVDYNVFLREIKKYEDKKWDINYNEHKIKYYYNYSTIFYLTKYSVHINNKYMIFYPIDYIKYRLWLCEHTSKTSNRVKGLWEENYEQM